MYSKTKIKRKVTQNLIFYIYREFPYNIYYQTVKLTTIKVNLCIVNYLQKGKPIQVIIPEQGVNDLRSKIYFNQSVKRSGTVEQQTVQRLAFKVFSIIRSSFQNCFCCRLGTFDVLSYTSTEKQQNTNNKGPSHNSKDQRRHQFFTSSIKFSHFSLKCTHFILTKIQLYCYFFSPSPKY